MMGMRRLFRSLFLPFLLLVSCSGDRDEQVYIAFNVPVGPLYAPCEVKFLNYTQNATEFLWDFGDGSGSDAFQPMHLYSQPGLYQVTLTASNRSDSKSLARELRVLETEPVVTAPPVALGLDPFYLKYVDAQGIPIISSGEVPDEALLAVRRMAIRMLGKIPEVREKMITYRARVGVMGKDEVTTDIPEHAFLRNDPNTDWDKRARGLGGTIQVPVTTCAEENVLCYAVDPYRSEDIFVHEFAHAIHLMGIRQVDGTFESNLRKAYNEALAAGKWNRTYAATNTEEYWAEGVQSWFNCNTQSDPPNGVHNHVNTRSELKAYDRGLYELLSNWFEDDDDPISCHNY